MPEPVSDTSMKTPAVCGVDRVSGADAQFAAGRHGIQRVVTQVQQDLFDLVPIRIGNQAWLAQVE